MKCRIETNQKITPHQAQRDETEEKQREASSKHLENKYSPSKELTYL